MSKERVDLGVWDPTCCENVPQALLHNQPFVTRADSVIYSCVTAASYPTASYPTGKLSHGKLSHGRKFAS